MTDPKIFFRELDALLATIRIEDTAQDLLTFIVHELEKKFSDKLAISDGRVYEQRGENFVFIFSNNKNNNDNYSKQLPLESPAVQLVFKNRSYIYDHPEQNACFLAKPQPGFLYFAAIWVHSPEKQWMLVFQLNPGWVREEISLFLNTVRTALNYRLFSDIMGGRLEQAAQIQKSLLPRKSPTVPGYDIYGHSQAAEFVGGDFYEYFELDKGSVIVSIGDASGHGFPAALLVRDVVIGLRMGLAHEYRVVFTVQKLNKVIQKSTYSTNYVSLFICELENDGHLFYVNAGHPGPLLISGEKTEQLDATGITLGFLPEIQLGRSYVRIPRDSVLVLYSDGIVERTNADNEHFGTQRLADLVRKNQTKSAREILETVFENVFNYGGRTNWEDDATMVVIKRNE